MAKLVDQLLKGKPATESSVKYTINPDPHKGRITVAPRKYIVGRDPTHKPHKVEFKGMTLSPAGVPTPHTWTVMHPGTLVKQ